MEFRPKNLANKPAIPPQICLPNGVEIPFMGLGTGGKSSTRKETEFAIRTALDLGYKHIDTAEMYGTEKIIGRVLNEYFSSGKLKRKDVFITTKLPCYAHSRESVEKSLRAQLAELQLDYVDLYLIHSPCAMRNRRTSEGKMVADPVKISLTETWTGMEDVYGKKLTRAIGLSNFNVDQIQRVYSAAKIKPHNLQVEMHAYWPQKDLITLCQAMNVSITAYAPLGSPGRPNGNGVVMNGPLADPVVQRMALKYRKTPAQILLRHMTQRKVLSMNFFMADEDIEILCSIRRREKYYLWEHRENHPEYPFDE